MANMGLYGWLQSIGYLAVALFVGIESLGVPLPGETMLITAAVFAADRTPVDCGSHCGGDHRRGGR